LLLLLVLSERAHANCETGTKVSAARIAAL